MKIEKNKVVAIDYTLKDNAGTVIDTSEGREPLAYIHGIGALIPGLEEELLGKGVGEKLNVSIPPEKAYGVRNEKLLQEVPKSNFANVPDIKAGMQFQAQSEQGDIIVTVVEVKEETIFVDGNHPLAGVTLNFAVEVKEVRDPSPEELEHGCLLYTSPSPRDKRQSRMPSSA